MSHVKVGYSLHQVFGNVWSEFERDERVVIFLSVLDRSIAKFSLSC